MMSNKTTHHGATSTATDLQLPAALSLISLEPPRKAEATTTTQVLQPRKQTRDGLSGGRWWLMAVPAFMTTAYAIWFVLGIPTVHPDIQQRILSSWHSVCHIGGGLVALAIGPFQFRDGLRRRRPAVHRWIGRVYVASVMVGGFGAFVPALEAVSYPIGDYGFVLLAVLWLISAGLGVSTIWRGDIVRHREWMIRNYALSYAAVMLRWQFPALIILGGLSIEEALTVVAFTCWMPNLVFVERWVLRRSSKPIAA